MNSCRWSGFSGLAIEPLTNWQLTGPIPDICHMLNSRHRGLQKFGRRMQACHTGEQGARADRRARAQFGNSRVAPRAVRPEQDSNLRPTA